MKREGVEFKEFVLLGLIIYIVINGKYVGNIVVLD